MIFKGSQEFTVKLQSDLQSFQILCHTQVKLVFFFTNLVNQIDF